MPRFRSERLQTAIGVRLVEPEAWKRVQIHRIPNLEKELIERNFRGQVCWEHRRILDERFKQGYDIRISALLRAAKGTRKPA